MIDVMLCVNHPRSGSPVGRISKVDIRQVDLELEGPMDWDDFELLGTTTFEHRPGAIVVDQARFAIRSYGTWAGNWCWDSATMELAEVLRLLNHLKRLRWDCHAAESTLFRRWRKPGNLMMADLEIAGLRVATDENRSNA